MSAAPRPVFAGRDDEIGVLRGLLDRAGDGASQVVLVTGEAGIGKSRLVEELCTGATGLTVLQAACTPFGSTGFPLGPVIEWIDEIYAAWPDLVARLTPPVAAVIRRLTEEIETDSAGGIATARVQAAIARLLEAAAQRCPTIVVLEDLHWADPSTTDLVAFLARRLRRAGLLIVLTSRPTATLTAAQQNSLAEVRRSATTELVLPPLTTAAVRQLISSVAGFDTSRERRILQLADGIPFYAVHLARTAGDDLPGQLTEVLRSSIAAVAPADRPMLLRIAVAETVAEQDLIRDYGADPTDAALASLDRAGLITRNGGTVRCRHALLRETVLSTSLPGERRTAHEITAEALLRRPDADPATVAHHLRAAGRDPDAVPFVLHAARNAAAITAFESAFTDYRWLVEHWPADGAVGDHTLTDVLLAGARAARWCGRHGDGLALLDTVDDFDVPVAISVEQLRGDLLSAAGDHTGALVAYERAGSLAVQPDRQHAAVFAALARAQMTAGSAVAAAEAAERAVRVAAGCGAEPERVSAAITLGVTHCQLGDARRGIAELRKALTAARDLDDLELVLRGYGNLTYALGVSGDNDAVADVAAEGIEFCRRYGPVLGLASTLRNNQIDALTAAGRWDEAVDACRAAVDETTTPAAAMLYSALLAQIAVARGDLGAARAAIAAVSDQDSGNVYSLSAVVGGRCEIARAGGDPAAALRIAETAVERLRTTDDPTPLLEVCAYALRAAADVGDADAERRPGGDLFWAVVQEAWSAGRAPSPAAEAAYAWCSAEYRRSSAADTPQDWAAAEEAHGRLGRPYHRAYCAYRAASAQLRGRSRAAAAGSLSRARDLAVQLEAGPLLTEIAALATLAGLGTIPATSPEKSRSGSVLSLTPREYDVLRLLVEGATNRLIARRLFISERTAGVHVSHILGKLGAANRTEAARLARSRGLV